MSLIITTRYSELSTAALARAEFVGSDLFLELNPDLPNTTTGSISVGEAPPPLSVESPDATSTDGVDMSEE